MDGRATVIDALDRRLPDLADSAVEELRVRFPDYRSREHDELLPGVAEDLRRALDALREQRPATAAEVEQAARVGASRAEQQIPAEVMLQGFQVVRSIVWKQAREIAAECAVQPPVLIEIAEDIWAWLDEVVTAAAGAHRESELGAARSDQTQRVLFVRDVALGRISALEIRTRCAAWGLDADADHVVVRLHPLERVSVRAVHGHIDRALHGQAFLLAQLDDDVVVIAQHEPRLPSRLAVVAGAGPAVALTRANESFAIASRVLEAARSLGARGVHSVQTLGLRSAVVTEAELGDELVQRLLDPVIEQGPEWEQTLQEYLCHDLAVRPTAEALGVHPNTVRYRIRRFEELTDSDTSRVDDLVELWWALQRRQVRADPEGLHGSWSD